MLILPPHMGASHQDAHIEKTPSTYRPGLRDPGTITIARD